MDEMGIPPPKFCLSKDCSQMKAAKTDSSGWSWPPGSHLSSAPKTLGLLAFLSDGKEPSFLSRHPWPKLGFHLNILYIQGLLPEDSCQKDRSGWLWPLEGHLSSVHKPLGLWAFPLVGKTCPCPGWHSQNWNSSCKIPHMERVP